MLNEQHDDRCIPGLEDALIISPECVGAHAINAGCDALSRKCSHL